MPETPLELVGQEGLALTLGSGTAATTDCEECCDPPPPPPTDCCACRTITPAEALINACVAAGQACCIGRQVRITFDLKVEFDRQSPKPFPLAQWVTQRSGSIRFQSVLRYIDPVLQPGGECLWTEVLDSSSIEANLVGVHSTLGAFSGSKTVLGVNVFGGSVNPLQYILTNPRQFVDLFAGSVGGAFGGALAAGGFPSAFSDQTRWVLSYLSDAATQGNQGAFFYLSPQATLCPPPSTHVDWNAKACQGDCAWVQNPVTSMYGQVKRDRSVVWNNGVLCGRTNVDVEYHIIETHLFANGPYQAGAVAYDWKSKYTGYMQVETIQACPGVPPVGGEIGTVITEGVTDPRILEAAAAQQAQMGKGCSGC